MFADGDPFTGLAPLAEEAILRRFSEGYLYSILSIDVIRQISELSSALTRSPRHVTVSPILMFLRSLERLCLVFRDLKNINIA